MQRKDFTLGTLMFAALVLTAHESPAQPFPVRRYTLLLAWETDGGSRHRKGMSGA